MEVESYIDGEGVQDSNRYYHTKANLKNECAKSDCNRYLGPVAVVLKGNGNAKDFALDSYEEAGKRG